MKKETYVRQGSKMIYKIAELELRSDNWVNITLELVCGWDYIDADGSDEHGFVGKENFVEEAEFEYLSCDIMNESVMQVLNENGYHKIKNLPTIRG